MDSSNVFPVIIKKEKMNHLLTICTLIAGYYLGQYLTRKTHEQNQADVNVEEAKRIINNKTRIHEN